jgi:hypothetical protein
VAPWTHRASFSWRQNVGFFERRYEILRTLEGEGLLRRFDDRGDYMAVRLQGPHQLLIFGEDQLYIGLFKPNAVMDVARAAAQVVCDALEPQLTGSHDFRFQWLDAQDQSYEHVRRATAAAFLGTGHSANLTDFALLIDTKFDPPFDEGHLEFGIVDAREAPMRLAHGSLGAQEPHDAPPGLWSAEELPPVAVFCDLTLDTAIPLDDSGDIVTSMFATFEKARDAADALRASLLRPLEEVG